MASPCPPDNGMHQSHGPQRNDTHGLAASQGVHSSLHTLHAELIRKTGRDRGVVGSLPHLQLALGVARGARLHPAVVNVDG
jgi:hypothetical protein